MSSERGAAAAVSFHDTAELTTLGGNGLHRPQGFPEWLPLTCWDVLTSWPARWTPSPGRRSVHIGNPGYALGAHLLSTGCAEARAGGL